MANLGFDPIHTAEYLMILDNTGYPISYHRIGRTCHDFRLQPDGTFTYYDSGYRTFIQTDTTYTQIGTFAAGNGYVTDAHELLLLPNGHTLLIALDREHVRMDSIVPGGDPDAMVTGNAIQELDQSQSVVFQWRSWDHFSIVDAVHEDLTAPTIDYVHMNAIDIDSDGNLLISSRHLSEVTKIDRNTGDIIWRLGGVHNEFTFVNDSLGFSYQHAIRRIPNGNITLFDNGNYHTPPFSRAVEYQLDESSMTATLVWQYRNTPDVFGASLGYAQRLDNGNTLIGWGSANPSVTEVRPDGSKALELNLPRGIYTSRAIRFPWPPGMSSVVEGPSMPGTFELQQNDPNPFSRSTTLRYTLPRPEHVRLTVYDTLGRMVARIVDDTEPAGSHEAVFLAGGLASGVYFYRLQAGDFAQTRRLLLLK